MDALHFGIRPGEGAGIGLDFVPRLPLNSVQMLAKQNKGRLSLSANQTASFFFVVIPRASRSLPESGVG